MYGIIYLARNLTTQKIYIGQTKQSLNARISDHWCAARDMKRIRLSRHFIYALRNQPDPKNWEWKVLDEAEDREDLNKKEVYWITVLEACDPLKGYNLQPGGYGGAGSPKGTESYKQWKAKMDVSAPWKQPKNTKEYIQWHEKCRQAAIQKRGLHILCIELNREFSNRKEASNWMKSQGLGCGIRHALESPTHTAGGYHWKQISD
jgi:hypothetical protein